MPTAAITPPLTPEQRSFFGEHGYLLLKAAIPKAPARALREQVLEDLKRLKIWASGKTLSAPLRQLPAFQQINKLSGLIKPADLQARLIPAELRAAIDSLAGGKLVAAEGQMLVSLPRQGDWTLAGLNWHTDVSATDPKRIPGIQAFVLIDDVQPQGGATLAMAGSHRLASLGTAGQAFRGKLHQPEALADEMRRHGFSVVEMCGQAGDLYLMDMRTLHTPSINASDKLRIMATVRYLAD